jgi:hypothetical protein
MKRPRLPRRWQGDRAQCRCWFDGQGGRRACQARRGRCAQCTGSSPIRRHLGIVVEVSLLGNPGITTIGTIREVSPSADPITRTYRVKVALPEAPEDTHLGMSVTGRVHRSDEPIVVLPPTALFQKD